MNGKSAGKVIYLDKIMAAHVTRTAPRGRGHDKHGQIRKR
jgi:hypothetical protein